MSRLMTDRSRAAALSMRLSDAFLIIVFAVQCLGQTLGYNSGDEAYVLITALGCVLLANAMICRAYGVRDVVVALLLIGVALLNMMLTGEFTVLLSVLLILAAWDMEIRLVLLCACLAKGVGLAVLALFGWVGVFDITRTTHYSAAAGGFVTRIGINGGSTNIVHLCFFTVLALSCVLWRRASSLPSLSLMFMGNAGLYLVFTRSITGLAVTSGMLLLAGLLRYWPWFAAVFDRCAHFVVPACVLFFLGTGYLYRGASGWLGTLDHLMTGRIRNDHWWLANYGVSLFGQSSPVRDVAFDNSVVYMAVRQGLVLSVLLFGAIWLMLLRYGRQRRTDMTFLLFVVFVYAMSESFLPSAVTNPALFALLPLIRGSHGAQDVQNVQDVQGCSDPEERCLI
ncbi:hypothetical protein JS531_09300 [Bifidobacterium sp. CP2]|uniref:hypothetical protein n=1 Tax=Bifidobacterium sp. CP2 TaxID=2809025 RepID=UPI001BDCB92B|nr:hypothetical protein [Bifidobacterium sp. CP2]MBT1182137.1 hypothetical protein [Bifidobacterium sp. CP2]